MSAVQGNRAHDATDRGAPIKTGGKAVANTDPTAVADGDRVDAWYDVQGALVTDDRAATWVESASSISSVANSVSHASTSGQTHYLTGIQVGYTTSVYKVVRVYDGAAQWFSIAHQGNPTTIPFARPLKFTQGNKIVVVADSSGVNGSDCHLAIFGYTKDD